MVTRLLLERMAYEAGVRGLTAPGQTTPGVVADPEKLEVLALAALVWVEATLTPFRQLPCSPYQSDEAVATVLLEALQEQRAHE